MKMKLLSLSLLAVAGCAAATAADIDVSVVAQIRLGKAPPPAPPEVVIVDSGHHHGPPPWAPAHGRRAKMGYYYYPACNVYYRPADHTWFFLDGGNWRLGASLPHHIQIDFSRSVSLEMDSDRPYLRHREVVKYYPHDYFTRVKIKHVEQPTAVVRVRVGDNDKRHPGRGHGPGKGKGRKR